MEFEIRDLKLRDRHWAANLNDSASNCFTINHHSSQRPVNFSVCLILRSTLSECFRKELTKPQVDITNSIMTIPSGLGFPSVLLISIININSMVYDHRFSITFTELKSGLRSGEASQIVCIVHALSASPGYYTGQCIT